MTVRTETAVVYRGGGRRWFTLNAACRAQAFAKIRRRYGRAATGEDYDHDETLRRVRIARTLAHLYRRQFEVERAREERSDDA